MPALLLGIATAGSASAAVILHGDRAAFDLANPGAVLETFESDSVGPVGPGSPFVESGLTASVDKPSWLCEVTTHTAMSYNTTPGGARHFRVGYGTGDYTVSFEFAAGMSAFAFDITGYQNFDAAGGYTVNLYNGETLVDSVFLPNTTIFLEKFHGFSSTNTFTRVAITITGSDATGFDQLAFVPALVPAPGTVALLGLLGLGTGRRRRR